MRIGDSLRYFLAPSGPPRESREHLKAAADWLLTAQEKGGGGYAHSYSLKEGWRPPYSETTGYLIPTMLRLADFLKDPQIEASAATAGAWLVKVQNSDGSYDSLSKNPMVFNTGQIVQGLLAIFRRTRDSSFLAAAEKAGDWIAAQQEAEGSWVRNSYGGIRHSYYIKVAAALYELGDETGKDAYHDAARRNLAWTLAQQRPNGFFNHAAFSAAEKPFLHTIVYVAEGLLAVHERIPDPAVPVALKKWGESLRRAEQREFPLYSRYNEEWEPALRQRCLTGLSQWAFVGLKLGELFKEPEYKMSAEKNIQYLKSRQIFSSSSALHGALPASVPIWGAYLPYSFINWGQKYFIDALLAQEGVGLHE